MCSVGINRNDDETENETTKKRKNKDYNQKRFDEQKKAPNHDKY